MVACGMAGSSILPGNHVHASEGSGLQAISNAGKQLEKLTFFDCSCTLGTRQIKYPASYYRLEDHLRKMKHYGIDKALACHTAACAYNQTDGNRMLMEMVNAHAQLQGKWVVLPHHTGEFPKPDELRRQLKSAGTSCVTIMPRSHVFSTEKWVCGGLFAMLEKCKTPLFVSSGELGYDALRNVLSAYPGLRVVLTDLNCSCARNLYPLLETFQHLYIETIGFKVFGGIEDVCRRFGARRLIFGTSAPLYSGAGAVGMVTYADISHNEKQMIASGNLEKLIKEVAL